jgi:tetratricopeptide (TPR) repeat protein
MMDIEELNKAIHYTQVGNFQEAEIIYKKLLEDNSDNFLLLSAVGLFYINLGNYEIASSYLQKAYGIKKTLGSVSALGFAEFEQSNYEKAAEILEEALIYGENIDIYDKLIISLFQIRHYSKAIELSKLMYEKYPENVHSVTNMVKSLTYSGKMLEAEKMCVEYLKEHSNSSGLWLHLGFLKELIYSDDKQACECYKVAADLGNNQADYNIAVSYQKQREFKQAEFYYKKMLDKYPEDTETLTSLGMCYLTQKKFKEGYEVFYNRKTKADKRTNNLYKIGDNLNDELVIICDQGFGDHIQFVRYLPFIKSKVKSLKVASSPTLIELFQKNYPDIEFITYSEINPEIQAIRICDLAYILDMDFENIPYSEGYLNAPSIDLNSDKIKVGFCWEAGAAGIRTMINRTINVNLFEKLFQLENIQIYSLQVQDTLHGNDKYPQMINLAKDFKSFEDTAKVIKSLDLVITVDTAVAHLAGALGIKTFLMLPYVSDWRWFDDTKNTSWYKSVEIFKQNDPISWEKQIGEILCRLKEFSL